MSQTNDIHPQLGAPPSPMTEEGTTGVPARDDAIDDQVGPAGGSDTPVYDSLASEHAAEDGSVDFGSTADDDAADDEEPDELGGFVVTDEDDTAPEQVVTEEYSVTDERQEGDPTPPDVPVSLQDDGTGVEDADVETSTADAPAVAAAAAAGSTGDAPTGTTGPSAADTDFSIGHVFDQTNGVIDGLEGESDGSSRSEDLSDADRSEEYTSIEDAGVHGDRDGVADLRDPNP